MVFVVQRVWLLRFWGVLACWLDSRLDSGGGEPDNFSHELDLQADDPSSVVQERRGDDPFPHDARAGLGWQECVRQRRDGIFSLSANVASGIVRAAFSQSRRVGSGHG